MSAWSEGGAGKTWEKGTQCDDSCKSQDRQEFLQKNEKMRDLFGLFYGAVNISTLYGIDGMTTSK